MKFLPDDLKKEYEYEIKPVKSIEELTEPFIDVTTVIQAHFILAHYFTDNSADAEIESMLVGVKSYDLLYSAAGRQIVAFDGKLKYTNHMDICSTLFYGLVKNHAFNDGNKRTALLILLYQLSLYGYFPKQDLKSFEKLVVSVAANELNKDYPRIYKKCSFKDDVEIHVISSILKRLTAKKDRKFHLDLTMREFCNALEEQGVEYHLENNKIKFMRTKKILQNTKNLSYTVNFYGWTRAVEQKMARDTLTALEITEEHSSISNIFSGQPSFYKLINQFEIPLRRLKDE